jgi:hypothetical protein
MIRKTKFIILQNSIAMKILSIWQWYVSPAFRPDGS